jgi:hypothetical protein
MPRHLGVSLRPGGRFRGDPARSRRTGALMTPRVTRRTLRASALQLVDARGRELEKFGDVARGQALLPSQLSDRVPENSRGFLLGPLSSLARSGRASDGCSHRGGQVDGGNEVSLLSSGYPQGKCLTDPVHRLCDRTPLGVRAGNSRDGGDPPPPFISLELYLIRRSHRAPSSQAVPRSHRRYSRRPVQGRGIDGRRSRDRRKREPEPTRHPRAIGHTMNAGAHGLDDAHGLVPHRQRVGGMGLLHE